MYIERVPPLESASVVDNSGADVRAYMHLLRVKKILNKNIERKNQPAFFFIKKIQHKIYMPIFLTAKILYFFKYTFFDAYVDRIF